MITIRLQVYYSMRILRAKSMTFMLHLSVLL